MKMKKRKISLISTCVACTLLISGIGAIGVNAGMKYLTHPGMSDITYFGAKTDGSDCHSAIEKAMTSGSVYIPEGEYVIQSPLSLYNVTLKGAGSDKTTLVADFPDAAQAILYLGRTCCISGLTVKYKDGLVTGEEKKNERVGIYGTSGSLTLQRGSELADVVVTNVGTGIASGTKLIDSPEDVIFSVTFDGVTVSDFSYRGLDFEADTRTGNYFKDITVSSGKFRAENAVYFSGEESETAIDRFVVKDTIAESPVMFSRMNALSAKNIVLDNVYALHGPIITWDSSAGHIDYLFFDYCDTAFEVLPMIEVQSTVYVQEHIKTLNGLDVGTLKLNSMNSCNTDKIIQRKNGESSPFYFSVEEYIVKNSDFTWDEFPADELNLQITKKGKIAERGTTDERPEKCLCPYYTRYYDTTLSKEVVWTGEEWK